MTDAYVVIAAGRARGLSERAIARQLGLRDGQMAYGVARFDGLDDRPPMVTSKPRSVDPLVCQSNPFDPDEKAPAPVAAPLVLTVAEAHRQTATTINGIIDALALMLDKPTSVVIGPRRSRTISWPRQSAMWLAYLFTPSSLPTIGRAFGHRDHTTVMHAIYRVVSRLKADDPDEAPRIRKLAEAAGINRDRLEREIKKAITDPLPR